jgi:hypothetical protein
MLRWGVGLVVTMHLASNVDAGNLLSNGDFETGDLSSWRTAWLPDQSGALVTATAARGSGQGLWIYTANSYAGVAFASVYQEFPAEAGNVFVASAYIRTPAPGQWVDWVSGSYACVRVLFMATNGTTLASYDSPCLMTGNTPYGNPYQVTTQPAPAGTAHVRFVCYLYELAGDARQSIANFDDCNLELLDVTPPRISLSPLALGFGFDLKSLTFNIENTGSGTLSWSVTADTDWITVTPNSGTTTTELDTITVTVERAGLKLPRYNGVITVNSNGGAASVDAYMETTPPYSVPQQPSIVTTDGYRLMVQRRLPDATLASVQPYTIKGTAWSPAGIGTTTEYYIRRDAFADWYRLDIQMLKAMHANTVYTFLDFGTDPSMLGIGLEILDYCYYNGIMVIMTVDENGSDNTENITQVVTAYKNHPALLMWALGNEWNLWRPDRPYYYNRYGTLTEAALAMQSNALLTQSLDANHPVCSILGEINYPTQAQIDHIVSNVCTAVDVWGANIFRGPEFYGLFAEWEAISTKPLFLSEFGTDAFHTTTWWPPVGFEDEAMQAAFDHSLWGDLTRELSACNPARVCLGGTVFEWNDEWWKSNTGTPYVHEPDGYETTWNPIAHPDGFANEEWFGIVSVERRQREAYFTLAADFGVDLDDFAVIAGCMGGPGVTSPPGCTSANFDSADFECDNDVDLADLAILQRMFTGSDG